MVLIKPFAAASGLSRRGQEGRRCRFLGNLQARSAEAFKPRAVASCGSRTYIDEQGEGRGAFAGAQH